MFSGASSAVVLILLTSFGFAMYFVANAIGGQAYAKMRSSPDGRRRTDCSRSAGHASAIPPGRRRHRRRPHRPAPAARGAATPRSGSEVYPQRVHWPAMPPGRPKLRCSATLPPGRSAPLRASTRSSAPSSVERARCRPRAGNPALTEDDRPVCPLVHAEKRRESEAAGMIDAARTGAAGSTDPVAKDEAPTAESVGSVDSSGQAAVTAYRGRTRRRCRRGWEDLPERLHRTAI